MASWSKLVENDRLTNVTARKRFSIKDFFSKYFSIKCDQIRRNMRSWSHLIEKSLMKKFSSLCSVYLGVKPETHYQLKLMSFMESMNAS